MIKIPDGFKVIGWYGRNKSVVYLKRIGKREKAATPFSTDDETFNTSLPSQKSLFTVGAR